MLSYKQISNYLIKYLSYKIVCHKKSNHTTIKIKYKSPISNHKHTPPLKFQYIKHYANNII